MMGKKSKVLSFILLLALVVGILPKHLVLADVSEEITFDEAITTHDENMENYWGAVEAFYGPNEETPGAIGRYWEARDTFADNVEELYQAAVESREACVEAYEAVVESYDIALELYNQMDENDKADWAEWKFYFDEGFSDATNTMEGMEEVPPIVDDMYGIYINDEGYLNGNPNAPEYWKVSDDGLLTVATEDDYSLKIVTKEEFVEMQMKDFVFTSRPEWISDAIWAEYPIVLELVGENRVTAERGNVFCVIGNVVVNGNGSLELIATQEEIDPENGDEPFSPTALFVGGRLENHATIICDSKNPDNTVFIDCEAKDIANTGTIKVGEGQKIGTWDTTCDAFVSPENYENSADYPVPTDHVYIGKVYYYTPDTFYPNNIYKHEDDTEQWTVYGKYDENGNPIGSNVWYQYWYVDERGGILTEDLVNPTQYLVYEENPEELIKDKDIASISDGKTHVFDADLYALWFTDGDVTVNGNIIQDFACFNVAERIPAESGEYFDYVFDGDGNRVWLTASNEDSKVVVNGNVGLISLNDSFEGDVTVNGKVELIGFYEDLHPTVTNTWDRVPETFYGSKANAGDIIVNGEFKGISKKALDGFCGYSVFNTEDFYAQTEREINGERVHGTSAAIKGDELLVDVSKDEIGTSTWPCVKEVDKNEEAEIKGKLTKKDSKLLVMDICLIQDNSRKIEPTTTVNLYFDNISGFEKPAVYHIQENGEIEKVFIYDGTEAFGGKITCSTNSFSTYFIAEDQLLVGEEVEEDSKEDTPIKVPNTGDLNRQEVYVILLICGVLFIMASFKRKTINR
ncbi:MAG: hypothetical protein IJA07_07120 [Agathobacter sp.]|nr:hypothetical protein [Agathobacter sp.]